MMKGRGRNRERGEGQDQPVASIHEKNTEKMQSVTCKYPVFMVKSNDQHTYITAISSATHSESTFLQQNIWALLRL